MDFLGFWSISLDNSNTSCRMVRISLLTLGEQSENSGSGCSHFHLANAAVGTTKYRTTLLTWAGKPSSTSRRALLTE